MVREAENHNTTFSTIEIFDDNFNTVNILYRICVSAQYHVIIQKISNTHKNMLLPNQNLYCKVYDSKTQKQILKIKTF